MGSECLVFELSFQGRTLQRCSLRIVTSLGLNQHLSPAGLDLAQRKVAHRFLSLKLNLEA